MLHTGLSLLLLLVSLHMSAESSGSQQPLLYITHVTVIDGTGAPAQPDMTVAIAAGRIRALGSAATVAVPSGAGVLDGRGKFLIPGLWDMHVHVLFEGVPDLFFPLFIANGVTGIRDMSSDLALAKRLRDQMAGGAVLGPRIVAASPIVVGPTPFWPGSIAVNSESEARDAVRSLKERGADFVKVYTGLSRDAYFAVLDEARRLGLPVAGHVPPSVRISEASDSGQRSVEHLDGVFRASSDREEEIRAAELEILERVVSGDTSEVVTSRRRELQELGWATYSEARAAALVDRLARNRTWQVPTLVALRLYTVLDDASLLEDPRLKYVPGWLKPMWDLNSDPRTRDRKTPEELAFARRLFARYMELILLMHRRGVPLMAGTDALNPYCYPGFSLHDELELLVRAGLTPMEALQSATLNPATFVGQESEFGTIQKGKVADLVLLEANPLEDIRNTKRIAAVVVRGKLFPKPALDKMLEAVAEMAKKN